MYISRETAQEIVEEIGGEIGAHINLMDERGCIIASTNAARIGNLHEGARRIIQDICRNCILPKRWKTP